MVATPKVFGGRSKSVLEIRPDSPFIVFQGDAHHAEPLTLTGKLILTNHDSIPVRSIKLSLHGTRKVSWLTNAVNPQQIVYKDEFLREQTQIYPTDLGVKKTVHHMGPGVHEWNFKFTLKGSLPESVEGLAGSYIVYNLHATMDRGMMAKTLYADKHIRVIRTLASEILSDAAMEQTNEDVWADKLCYKITIPQTNFIYGTQAIADFQLIPLKKGVTIGKIKMELHEHVVLNAVQGERNIPHSWDAIVAKEEYDMPSDAEQRMGDEDEDRPFDESFKFKLALSFPKSLKKCRQNVDTDFIRIDHKIKLFVNLHNPEGHTSQLLVKNNCVLFISPNLPIGEDQQVLNAAAGAEIEAAMHAEATQAAPPTYAEHQLDQMYRDIDPSGFRTPGWRGSPNQSGYVTPFYTQSRRNSVEDVPSMDTVTGGSGASASQLHSRLARLSISQNNSFGSRNNSYSRHSSGTNTPHNGYESSAPISPAGNESSNSGNNSGRQSHNSMHHVSRDVDSYFPPAETISYDMEALARIPSYNTALRTPIRTPVSEDLPTYAVATSRPASPVNEPSHSRLSFHRGSRDTTPSPSGSLATLTEETERNTAFNRALRPEAASVSH